MDIHERDSSITLAVHRDYNEYMDADIEIVSKLLLKRDTWYTVKVTTTRANDGVNNLELPKTRSFKTK